MWLLNCVLLLWNNANGFMLSLASHPQRWAQRRRSLTMEALGIPPGMPLAPGTLDNDEVAEFLQFFLPVFKFLLFCSWILIEPVEDFIILVQNLLFVLIFDLAFKSVIFSLCFHIECSEFKWISGIHLVSSSHIQLCPSKPLDHMLSVSFAQRALVIFDGDLVLFSCTLRHSRVTWGRQWNPETTSLEINTLNCVSNEYHNHVEEKKFNPWKWTQYFDYISSV